jgi:hypothetical protein
MISFSCSQKFVEYYDLRDCEKAFANAGGYSFGGGNLDVRYAYIQRYYFVKKN